MPSITWAWNFPRGATLFLNIVQLGNRWQNRRKLMPGWRFEWRNGKTNNGTGKHRNKTKRRKELVINGSHWLVCSLRFSLRLLSLQTDEACRDFGDIAADMPDEEEDQCHPWRVSHVTCWIELASYWLVQNSFPWSDWRVFMFQSPSLWAAQIVFDGPMKAAEVAALTSLMSADPSGA